ncbi:MAG: peptidylprolyl isomerase [Planctomycetota bacterium]
MLLVGGQAVTRDQVSAALLEAGGPDALSELVLGRAVSERLAQRGVVLTEEDLAQERGALLQELRQRSGAAEAGADTEADLEADPEALLAAFRARRGLSAARFAELETRNAGLRRLVPPASSPSEASILRRYDLRYGPRYLARIVAVSSLPEAQEVLERLDEGEPFARLARELSTDPSGEVGGSLPAISGVDTAWPLAMRQALAEMAPGAVSAPIAVEGGYLILQLEASIADPRPPLQEVRGELDRALRLEAERLAMRRLARDLLLDASVMVIDPDLAPAWRRARDSAEPGERAGQPAR